MPEFTPLQLQLRLRGPKDIDVAMKTTNRVDVTCPELHSRRPFQTKSSPSPSPSSSAADSSASSSSNNSGKRKKTNGAYAATSDDDANQPPNYTKTTTTYNNNNNSHTTANSPPSPKMTTPSTPPPPPSLPPIATLAGAPIKTQMAALDTLFEPSTELHTLVLPALRARHHPGGKEEGATAPAPFGTYCDLIRHVGGQLAALADNPSPEARRKLHGVLGSHPRLGAAKVASAQSRAEQAQLQASAAAAPDDKAAAAAAAEEEARRLADLNAEYEARFPGLRFVVFVNGRGRPAVMTDMRRRIDRGDAAAEEREAIRAMVDIALDRAWKLGAAV